MTVLKPGDCVGILGGGQLGRMLALSSAKLGLKAHIYAPEQESPAFAVSAARTSAAYEDEKALAAFASACSVITYEFENVPARTAEFLAKLKPVRPSPRSLSIAQDRLLEKNFIANLGLLHARFIPVTAPAALEIAIKNIGMPCVLKTRRLGYDGKGQVLIERESEAASAWEKLGGAPAILESFISLQKEVSVIAVRGIGGEIETYDVAENVHRDHILHRSSVPAQIPASLADEARNAARKMAEALDYVGVLAAEFFVDASGELLVNEIAPRVHNSGHWTLDACPVSQFENHIRAIAGWPVGPTARLADAVMTNLIGDEVKNWEKLLSEKDISLWLYGKNEARPGRKMGHFTKLKAKC